MLIGQSGGPTVAINASLSGAIQRAMKSPEIDEVYGTLNGLEGVVKDRVIKLRPYFADLSDFRLLESTPAMALGSCRFKLPPYPNPLYEQVRDIFHSLNIGYFLYTGGNDSMDTVMKLSDYFKLVGEDIKCVGVPKTIDNDLPATDHTPGFGSAARYIATSIAEIACDNEVYDIPSITIVEVMGRDAGWLTASSVLARRPGCSAPQLIYLPEVPFDPEQFIAQLQRLQRDTKNIVAAVSEGVHFRNGEYVSASSAKEDAFGHRSLAGAGKYLESLARTRLGVKVRSIEMNILQRSASHLISETDLDEAKEIGAMAAELALSGQTGVMAVLRRVSNHPYLVSYGFEDIHGIANQTKRVPLEWITPNGCDVSPEMIEYLAPLINDHNGVGIPKFFSFLADEGQNS